MEEDVIAELERHKKFIAGMYEILSAEGYFGIATQCEELTESTENLIERLKNDKL